MTAALPAPPVPADLDLRGFPFMPLHVVRLRSSEQNSDVLPEANWAALQLWCASWHELPASSIPDNDQWQAKAAGYVSRGTVDARWAEIREGALRKFERCSDGRLYHPIVAEQALIAWASKLEQRWKSECARIKKHNQRHGVSVSMPSYDEWIAAGRPSGQPLPVPRDTGEGVPKDVPRDKASKGQGQGQGIVKNPSGSIEPETAKPKKGSKRVPKTWTVSPELITWAAEKAPDVDWVAETEKFRDWEFKHARTDWDATWRTWMRNAQDRIALERSKGAGADVKPGESQFAARERRRISEGTGGILASSAAVKGPLRTPLIEKRKEGT